MIFSVRAAEAGDRARVLEEFWQRKREALANKNRGGNRIGGPSVVSHFIVKKMRINFKYDMPMVFQTFFARYVFVFTLNAGGTTIYIILFLVS